MVKKDDIITRLAEYVLKQTSEGKPIDIVLNNISMFAVAMEKDIERNIF